MIGVVIVYHIDITSRLITYKTHLCMNKIIFNTTINITISMCGHNISRHNFLPTIKEYMCKIGVKSL